jgi:hypothetical protein
MKKVKRIRKKAYLKLAKLAARLNISFSKCIAIGGKVFGLDEKNKKLLIAEQQGDQTEQHIIELEKVKTVSLKKSYNSIPAGELSEKGIEEFINQIRLQFEPLNNDEQTIISFYDREKDQLVDLKALDSNSQSLHKTLSVLIGERKDV